MTQFASRIRTDFVFARVLLLSIAPTVMWAICRKAWGIENGITGDLSSGWSRLTDRLVDGVSSRYALHVMTVQATAVWMLVGILATTVMFSIYRRPKLHRGALLAGATAALYFSGLYVTYLSTPYGLQFHLATSATRTMTTTSMALLVSLFFLLCGLEVDEGRSGR